VDVTITMTADSEWDGAFSQLAKAGVHTSADGYSHSYRTNGSGYALIYLNGPPAGATITVTVGGAACTTSD
jgi:hypothetical protein